MLGFFQPANHTAGTQQAWAGLDHSVRIPLMTALRAARKINRDELAGSFLQPVQPLLERLPLFVTCSAALNLAISAIKLSRLSRAIRYSIVTRTGPRLGSISP